MRGESEKPFKKFSFSLYLILTKRWVYHSLFWLSFYILSVSLLQTEETLQFALLSELINVVFYAAIVYINLFVLIPKYLREDSFWTYSGYLIFSAFVIAAFKIGLTYYISGDHINYQSAIVNNQLYVFLQAVLFGVISTILRILTDWSRNQSEKMELRTQTMQSELNFLKTQINPHFLFNTLNALYALTLKKSEMAPEVVLKLSEMMRYMLYECNEKQVPLYKEVNYIQNYLDLEKLRQQKDNHIDFEIDGNIEDIQIAPLILITFIENSFKHGLKSQLKPGFVHITLHVIADFIHFEVENSKPDVLPNPGEHRVSGGIGLANVRRRLDLLYPNAYQLDYSQMPDRYKVTLSIKHKN
ncbi:MAG: histidine kinase [Saprospiraceae bacterium]